MTTSQDEDSDEDTEDPEREQVEGERVGSSEAQESRTETEEDRESRAETPERDEGRAATTGSAEGAVADTHDSEERSVDVQTTESAGGSSDGSRGGSNVGGVERVASLIAGGALVVRGLRRRGLSGFATAAGGGYLVYRGVSGRCPFYSAVGIDRSGSGGARTGGGADGAGDARSQVSETAAEIERAVTVGAPAEELHGYWRDPESLDRLLGEFASIEARGDERLHWTVAAPLGRTVEWETEFVEDRPGEVLRWETVTGTPLPSEWTVRYAEAPGDQGTEVSLRVRFDPPAGRLGSAVVDRLGVAPKAIVGATLRRFRSLAETGEMPTLEGNPSARGSGDLV